MRLLKTLVLATALVGAICGAAAAHTPYMKPSIFDPDGEWTSIQAAYGTEIFSPVVGIGSPDFHVLAPDGRRMAFSNVHVTPYETTLEMALPNPGTYRLTTGEVMGPAFRMIYQSGHWRALGPNETAPRGRRVSTMQLVTVAESYVTKGAPTRAALDPVIGTLAIRPITHPNEATVASGLELQLLFNGAPFPNMPIVLYTRGDSENDDNRVFVTDGNGHARLTFGHPGTYLAVVRYRPRAPQGAEADVRSYSTSLTFEVK